MNQHNLVFFLIPSLGVLGAIATLWGAVHASRRHRLMRDLPTLKTTGVFIGLVELKGTAEAEAPLAGHLSDAPCVFYDWSVDEKWSRTIAESFTDNDGNQQTRTRDESGWTTVADGGERIPFYLQDESGLVRVDPEKAKIEPVVTFDETGGPGHSYYFDKGPSNSIADSMHMRRFCERAIPLHAMLYVVGQARLRDDIVAPEIAYHPRAEMFLISTRSEERIRRGLTWGYCVLALVGVILAVGGFVLRDLFLKESPGEHWSLYLFVGGYYLLAWFGAWYITAYNSLIGLRQRVEQAWSNIDVQLQRRHDLIPNLVKIVEGFRDHERVVQTEVAKLRSQLNAVPPGEAGEAAQPLANVVLAIQERYPELKANESFLSLQSSLIATEECIALARGYYNEVASHFNARLQIIPDRLVAVLAGLRPKSLMLANDFERAPVNVQLAD